MTLHILRAPTGPTRPLVQLRVYVEVFDALERTENGRQEQLCDPLVPGYTYWYLSAAPELLALAAARLEKAKGPRA